MCKRALCFFLVNISSCDEHFLWVAVLFTIPHSLCSHHFPPLHQRYCFIPVSQSIIDGFGFLTMSSKFRPMFQTDQVELLKKERGQSMSMNRQNDCANIFQRYAQVELCNSGYLSSRACVCGKMLKMDPSFSAKWKWKQRDKRTCWPILGICVLHLTHPKCTHTDHEHTPRAVIGYLCCGVRGAVWSSVPCSRAPQSWYWGWRVCCTPLTYNSCQPETRTLNLSIASPTL